MRKDEGLLRRTRSYSQPTLRRRGRLVKITRGTIQVVTDQPRAQF